MEGRYAVRRHAVGTLLLATATLLSGCSDSTGVGYENAIVASMQTDLVELLAAQDAFHVTNGNYAGSIGQWGDIAGGGGAGVVKSWPTGRNVVVLYYVSDSSWAATIWNSEIQVSPNVCGIYHGPASVSPDPSVTAPRTVECWHYRY